MAAKEDVIDVLEDCYRRFKHTPKMDITSRHERCAFQGRYVELDPRNIRRGDHIAWYRNPYYRHAIVVSEPIRGGAFVIRSLQTAKNGDAKLGLEFVFLPDEKGTLLKVNYNCCDKVDVAVARAYHLTKVETRFGNYYWNNCEEFATWCKAGESSLNVARNCFKISAISHLLALILMIVFRFSELVLILVLDLIYDVTVINVDVVNVLIFLGVELFCLLLHIVVIWLRSQRQMAMESGIDKCPDKTTDIRVDYFDESCCGKHESTLFLWRIFRSMMILLIFVTIDLSFKVTCNHATCPGWGGRESRAAISFAMALPAVALGELSAFAIRKNSVKCKKKK